MVQKIKLMYKPILFILLAWIVLVVLRSSDTDMSFTVLTNRYGQKNISPILSNKITGEFVAKHNNLGIIGVRLITHDDSQVNKLKFFIKESDAVDWYYVNTYRVTTLPNTNLFPFGFPIIKQSAGKSYKFELDLVEDGSRRGLELDSQYPVYTTYYKYYKRELLTHPSEFIMFLINKTESYFTNFVEIGYLTIYLGVVVTLYCVISPILLRRPSKVLPFALIITVIVFDIYFDYNVSEVVSVGLTSIVILSLLYQNITSRTLYIIGFMYFVLCSVFLFVGSEQMLQKAGIWGFIFLCIGFVKDAYESVRSGSGRTALTIAKIPWQRKR